MRHYIIFGAGVNSVALYLFLWERGEVFTPYSRVPQVARMLIAGISRVVCGSRCYQNTTYSWSLI
jgi:hypothetical protein